MLGGHADRRGGAAWGREGCGRGAESSIRNKQFQQHIRNVDSHGWTNYDNATLKGDCREVIDID